MIIIIRTLTDFNAAIVIVRVNTGKYVVPLLK